LYHLVPGNQANNAASILHCHSCPKSVLKKEGVMRGKISTKKKKTKMEIEFWGASY
jgi:hypothetical protein